MALTAKKDTKISTLKELEKTMRTARPLTPAVAIVDLECSNLDANFGKLLSACIKDYGEGRELFTYRIDDYPGYVSHPWDDRQLALDIRDRLETFDSIVGHFSQRFDAPFLNTRLLYWGERPMHKIKHRDTQRISKFNLKLSSNRLDTICKFLNLPVEKSSVDSEMWTRAVCAPHLPEGKEALDYIVEHCQRDILISEQVFSQLAVFESKVFA